MEADADSIGAAMASDSRVDGNSEDIQVISEFLFQLAFGFGCDVKGISMAIRVSP